MLEQELIALRRAHRRAAPTRSARRPTRSSPTPRPAALEAPPPDPAHGADHLVGPPPVTELPAEPDAAATGEVVTFGEAIRLTLHEQMARDERIRVFGEDVADADPEALDEVPGKGGVFGITFGLQREFGHARCFNTPLAEANIVGRAFGQAMRGLRPCPEIQFFDYVWPAMHQIKSEAATMRWRSNGAFSVPDGRAHPDRRLPHRWRDLALAVRRVDLRPHPRAAIAFPSRARDAAGLLRTAFRCEDPVLFLEHKHLYRQGYNRDPFPPEDWMLPFGRGTHRDAAATRSRS